MIKIIGDVHGKTGAYKRLVRALEPGQRSIQIGDMGVGFQGVRLHDMTMDHRWFRGNHDDPAKCRKNPNYLGDSGYLPEDKLFWLAGAYSIDRMMRISGVSWWSDEELSHTELDAAIKLYEQLKPKYVLTHEAPAKIAKVLLMGLLGSYFAAKMECTMSRTAEALQAMFEIHQPKEWVFGHYHVDRQIEWDGTLFTCVAELSTYDLKTDLDRGPDEDKKDDAEKSPEEIR